MSLRSVVLVAGFLMLVTVAGVSLAILLAFSRTISLAEETETRIIPDVLGQQTLAVLAVELARTAEVVLGTDDPVRRAMALADAERTAILFAPVADVGSVVCLDAALSAIRRSAYLRGLADALAMHRSGVQDQLDGMVSVRTEPGNARWSHAMLELRAILARIDSERDPERLQPLQSRVSNVRSQLAFLYDRPSRCPGCPRLEDSLSRGILSAVDLRREQLAVLVQAEQEAEQTRMSLERMTANLSRTAAVTVRSSAAAIVEVGWKGIVTGSALACGALVLIVAGGLLLIRHVVRPAVRAREALDAVYSGEPLPVQEHACLHEFQVIGEAVQRLAHALGELKDREQTALRSRQQLQYLLDISPAPFMLVDLTSGLVSNVNSAAASLFGSDCGSLSGTMAEDLWISHEAVSDLLSRLRRDELAERVDMQFRRVAAPPFWALVSARTGMLDGRAIALVGLADITERKQYENRLRSLVDDLERSNRELEQFAHIASSDLQEPLRIMVSYLQLVEHRAGNMFDESTREYMNHAVDGGRRMQRMIVELLEYSRIGRGGCREAVSLDDVVEQLANALRPVLEGHQVELSVDGRLPVVMGDPGHLASLFRNLVLHALNCRDPERTLTIVIHAEERGAFCECVVSDNGTGTLGEHVGLVSGIPGGRGGHGNMRRSGIGLSICRRVVESHGGRIWVDPAGGTGPAGQGCTIHFTLPLRELVSAG